MKKAVEVQIKIAPIVKDEVIENGKNKIIVEIRSLRRFMHSARLSTKYYCEVTKHIPIYTG